MNGLTNAYVLITAAYFGYARGESDQPLKEVLQHLSYLATAIFSDVATLTDLETSYDDDWTLSDEGLMLNYKRQLELVIILLAAGCYPHQD